MKTVSEIAEIQDGKVLFSASWCGPCSALIKYIESKGIEGIEIFKVDNDVQAVKTLWNVKTVPTLIVLDKGAEVGRFVGELEIKPQL